MVALRFPISLNCKSVVDPRSSQNLRDPLVTQPPGGRRAVTMSDAYAYSGGGGGKLKSKGVKDGKVDKRKKKKDEKPAPSSNGGGVEGENEVGEDKQRKK